MKQGAIFDQDGLLFDTEAVYQRSWVEAGKQLGLEVPFEFCTAVSGTSGPGMEAVIHRFFPEQEPQPFINLCFQLSYEEQDRCLPEKPGLHEILEMLRAKGVKIAVASSSYRDRVEQNLAASGIREYFDVITTRDDVSNGKPDPEIFLVAAAKLGLDPSDCYVFEDSFNGVRAGHAAGCFTVMVPDLKQPDETLAGQYDACCKSLLDAARQLEQGIF